jgi:surface polysaccharide O-acyltransferase-like enzyme
MGKLWAGVLLVLVLVVFPLLLVSTGVLEGKTASILGGLTWQSLAYSVWEEFICIGAIVVLLVGFRGVFNRQSALAKVMSDSTFTVYFIHAPVLVTLALALKRWKLHPLLKWALVSPLAIVACFAIAYLIRKVPFLNRIL